MKTLLYKILEAIIVLLSVFILGILIPILTSLILVTFSNMQFDECICSGLFWTFTVISWFFAGTYINECYKDF